MLKVINKEFVNGHKHYWIYKQKPDHCFVLIQQGIETVEGDQTPIWSLVVSPDPKKSVRHAYNRVDSLSECGGVDLYNIAKVFDRENYWFHNM